jgi:hypothetical protein
MEDLAERGFTGVLHTFSENDFNYYRQQMARIVEVSHDVGLEVQVGPWGVAHVFGGEAESLLLAQRPELGQVFDDGGQVGAGCLTRPEVREFVRRWADAAVELGADRIFLDEPHWAHPGQFGRTNESWTCLCAACRSVFEQRFGHPMPPERTPEVVAFHQQVLVDFIREIVEHVTDLGARSTVCLLPDLDWLPGVDDWEAVAAIPALDTLATDPYWVVFGEPLEAFVGGHARRLVDVTGRHGLTPQLWIQGFLLGPEHADEIHTAVRLAREAGVEDLWTWGYEACGHITGLGTREPEVVWEALTDALTGRSA